MNTPGYRAEEIKFSSIMAEQGAKDIKFASTGESYTSRRAGPITYTNSPYDVAVQGKGWFSVKTPDGVAYTRDGRFNVTADGMLVSVNNYPVLDQGGTAVMIQPNQGELKITADGTIIQGTNPVGTLGLFEIPLDAKLKRYDNSAVIPDKAATPVTDYNSNAIRQGYVEGSNVDPVMEMTRLIMVQRAFESAAQAISQQETSGTDSIRALGPQ